MLPQFARRLLVLFASLFIFSLPAFAGSPIYGAKDGPAIEGYDAVAYFTEGKPVEGKAEFVTEWNGAKWQFATAENRDKFQTEPEKYAPQYGGHCAFAMANDSFAEGDPHRWKIEDGKLYLNANKIAHWLWQKDIPGKIKSADAYWPAKMKKKIEEKS